MKITDFDLSYGDPSLESLPFPFGGTPMYESPELLRRKTSMSIEGDIFALRVFGYQLCELTHMFREKRREMVTEAI